MRPLLAASVGGGAAGWLHTGGSVLGPRPFPKGDSPGHRGVMTWHSMVPVLPTKMRGREETDSAEI